MADLIYLMGFLNHTPPLGEHETNLSDEHITLLSEVSVPDKNLNTWVANLSSIMFWHPKFTVKQEHELWLGSMLDIPAVSVTTNPVNAMQALHKDLLASLNHVSGKVAKPEYAGINFLPHISHAKYTGTLYEFTTLSLIHHQDGFGENVVNLANFNLAPLQQIF